MKKYRGFGKIHSWGHSNSIFTFLKFYFDYVWPVHLKEKKMISENLKI